MSEPWPDLAELFAQARKSDIEAVAGVKLWPAGRRRRGECPLCGHSKGKKSDGCFSVEPRLNVFKCWACGEGGDVITLEHKLRSRPDETPRHAAERLVGSMPALPAKPVPPPQSAPPDPDTFHLEMARALWLDSRFAVGTPVEAYLRGRGISGYPLTLALHRVRYHPRAYHSGPVNRPTAFPAMIGLVKTPDAATGGVHVTYLAPGGGGKAKATPSKRMWGPQSANGRPGGLWLTPRTTHGPLIVAEGIESALSAAILVGKPCRVVAALSLGALQGGWLLDKYGRLNPDAVSADPQKPPFTWPSPDDAPFCEVIIAVDRDMRSVPVTVRKPLGGTRRLDLTGEQRARICAALAEQGWRRANPGTLVSSIAPRLGNDFNDELRERLSTTALDTPA